MATIIPSPAMGHLVVGEFEDRLTVEQQLSIQNFMSGGSTVQRELSIQNFMSGGSIAPPITQPPIKKKLGPPVVDAKDLSKKYPIVGREDDISALLHVSLSTSDPRFPAIHEGEFVMIRGPSGGGKTTLLNMLGTIAQPSTGQIEINGQNIDNSSTDKELSRMRLKTIGFVFQTFNLLATLSAVENVELPMILLGALSPKGRRKRAVDLLTAVGLRDRLDHLPSEMSGGEMQRTAIARALANKPQILLLDEPTGDLDTLNTVGVMDLLLKINQQGFQDFGLEDVEDEAPASGFFCCKRKKAEPEKEEEKAVILDETEKKDEENTCGITCIMVTHNPDLECYADRIIYVKDGQLDKQEFNEVQWRLSLSAYTDFLNSTNA
eukprot:Platyproteum_vivax@DN8951_c0_g1_i1.p1